MAGAVVARLGVAAAGAAAGVVAGSPAAAAAAAAVGRGGAGAEAGRGLALLTADGARRAVLAPAALDIEVVFLPATIEDRFQPTIELLERAGDTLDGLILTSPSNPAGSGRASITDRISGYYP